MRCLAELPLPLTLNWYETLCRAVRKLTVYLEGVLDAVLCDVGVGLPRLGDHGGVVSQHEVGFVCCQADEAAALGPVHVAGLDLNTAQIYFIGKNYGLFPRAIRL